MQRTHLTKAAIEEMERLKRVKVINSLSGFKSVNLVGTVNKAGVTNLSIVSSVIHLGANPALMAFNMRPITPTVTRDTYTNIQETGYFTFNHITADFYKKAHQTSARYPAEVSEFDATGLNVEYKEGFIAPFVAESPVQIGLKFIEQIDIKLNGTVLMIGEIKDVYFPAECMGEDGFIDLQKAGTITVAGLDAYYSVEKLARLTYAKSDREVKEI